jgi:hypothetical protein
MTTGSTVAGKVTQARVMGGRHEKRRQTPSIRT